MWVCCNDCVKGDVCPNCHKTRPAEGFIRKKREHRLAVKFTSSPGQCRRQNESGTGAEDIGKQDQKEKLKGGEGIGKQQDEKEKLKGAEGIGKQPDKKENLKAIDESTKSEKLQTSDGEDDFDDMFGTDYSYTIDIPLNDGSNESDESVQNPKEDIIVSEEELKVRRFNPEEFQYRLKTNELFDNDNVDDYMSKLNLAQSKELRMVLVGRTGSGKSATGNTILGRPMFHSDVSASSITSHCSDGKVSINGRTVCVVDTPGVFDTHTPKERVQEEIGRCINLTTPGPHAIILVTEVGRFTPEVKATFEYFISHFGEHIMRYAIILFTRQDELKRNNKSIEAFIKKSPKEMHDFTRKFGRRFVAFDNTNDQKNKQQVLNLLEMIDSMVFENGGSYYSDRMYQKATKQYLEKIRMEKEKIDRIEREKREQIAKEVSAKFEPEVKKYKEKVEEYRKNIDSINQEHSQKMNTINTKMNDVEKKLSKQKSINIKNQNQICEQEKRHEKEIDQMKQQKASMENKLMSLNEEMVNCQIKIEQERNGKMKKLLEDEMKTKKSMEDKLKLEIDAVKKKGLESETLVQELKEQHKKDNEKLQDLLKQMLSLQQNQNCERKENDCIQKREEYEMDRLRKEMSANVQRLEMAHREEIRRIEEEKRQQTKMLPERTRTENEPGFFEKLWNWITS